jgi:hypothetical protein
MPPVASDVKGDIFQSAIEPEAEGGRSLDTMWLCSYKVAQFTYQVCSSVARVVCHSGVFYKRMGCAGSLPRLSVDSLSTLIGEAWRVLPL